MSPLGAIYDEMHFRACTLLYHEEAKSASFKAIFSHDNDHECKIWRELLRHRTIMLLEVVWRYLLDTKFRFLTKAWNEVGGTSLKEFGGTDLQEVRGVDEMTSVPGGHLGTRRRYQGDAPSMSSEAYSEEVRKRMRNIRQGQLVQSTCLCPRYIHSLSARRSFQLLHVAGCGRLRSLSPTHARLRCRFLLDESSSRLFIHLVHPL